MQFYFPIFLAFATFQGGSFLNRYPVFFEDRLSTFPYIHVREFLGTDEILSIWELLKLVYGFCASVLELGYLLIELRSFYTVFCRCG